MKSLCKKILMAGMLCLSCVCISACTGETEQAAEVLKQGKQEKNTEEQWMEAKTTPYGKYPEKITYTLGQMSGANNSNLPDGDTYEDNAYTRYLLKMLNIQNEMTFLESEDRYDEMLHVVVKDQKLPDVLVVSDRKILKELVENDLVEDLTEEFEKCASDRIKEMYESYGGELLEAGTFDGKLMAIPETVIDHGPCFMWLRKDWMDELGLKEPKTLTEAFDIVEAFVEKRMGTGEDEEPVGLVCDTALVGSTSSSYSVDPVFDNFGASPQRWVEKEGKIVYGSTMDETRTALMYLHELYKRGVLDQNFALRAQNNLRDLVIEGKCGAFFGLWWTPNNPLMDGYANDSESEWVPYYFKQDENISEYDSFSDNKYVVVRKGYKHPEIVIKILNVLFDYTRYEAEDADEVNRYFALNVDPTARPLVINVDYNEATYIITEHIREAIDGKRDITELSAIEKAYYDACSSYLSGDTYTVEDWAAYKSRISAVGLLVDEEYRPVNKKYLDDTDGDLPQSLQTLEEKAFIQIIMGEQPIGYFDEFVEQWYEMGGADLTEQIRKSNPVEGN